METEKTKNDLKSTLLSLLYILMTFTGIHILVMSNLLTYKNLNLVISIHLFLVTLLVIGVLAVKKVKSIDEEKVGMTFLAISIFKMLFSVGFLFVLFKFFETDRMTIIMNFFSAFFAYLLIEVLLSVKELR